MRGVKQVTRAVLVAVTLWAVFAVGSAWASSEQAGHANVATEHQQEATTHGSTADAHAAVDAHATDAHAEGGAAGAHGGGSLSAEKVKDLVWRVVNFIALMIILVKFGAKPIGAALSGRQKQVKDEFDDLQAKRKDAEQTFKDFESKLSTVEKDIDTIVEKAVAQAEVEKAKIIEKAEQAAADITRQAEMTVQKEIMEAKRLLKDDVAEQAAAMAEELIVKNLNQDDQVKIIEDYLDKVGAVQ